MSSPNIGPTQGVMHAANFLAREIARGNDPTVNADAYDTIVNSLSLAEQQEAFAIARTAVASSPLYRYDPTTGKFVGEAQNIQPGLSQGVYRVALRYEVGSDVDGDPVYSYRTVMVGAADFYTRAQIVERGIAALEDSELFGTYDLGDEPPTLAEVLYEPFNLS